MAITISIALQKGGVGKTTTAQALAGTLGHFGKKVLLIDMDSQANATYCSGIDNPNLSIVDVLGGDCKPEKAVIGCSHYDLLAADSYLTNVEMAAGLEPTLLRKSIKSLTPKYDYIIIDTPPALGNLSVNALTASDYVIIPTEARPFALTGIAALMQTIQSVKCNLNDKLKVLGILLIKYSDRTVLNKNVKEMLEDYARSNATFLFQTPVKEGVAVAEAQMVRLPLIDYAPKSKPCKDYIAVTKEILTMLGDKFNG